MTEPTDVLEFLVAVADLDHEKTHRLLTASPWLAVAALARSDECFLAARQTQIYEGDTGLHAAAFSYDADIARELIADEADIRARNRRGAEPLHAAATGVPGSVTWDPRRQQEVIRSLIEAGADPNARAVGGVTPLHRAVRNRCSAAVETLLGAGADPRLQNMGGSTASDLAHGTTGRGGAGSAEAKSEQRTILELLDSAVG